MNRILAGIFLVSSLALSPISPVAQIRARPQRRTNPRAAPGENRRFARLSDQFMKEMLARSPVSASHAGYHQHTDANGRTIDLDAELDDLSPDGFRRKADFFRQWRGRFRAESSLSSLNFQDSADWRLVDDQISLSLLDLDQIQSHRHQPTLYVELIGNALFLPLTQQYAPKEVRLGHVLSRLSQVPRTLEQAKQTLADSDPVFLKTAVEENRGNIELIQDTIRREIGENSSLRKKYDEVAPAAVTALEDFSRWLEEDLAKRKPSRAWRLGKRLYDLKFRYVMETPVTPAQLLADAERAMEAVRAEMLELSIPLHRQWYPDHGDHAGVPDRQNLIIGEVLNKIAEDHPRRDQLIEAVEKDLEGIQQFIREKKIVTLSERENLKLIPTPAFLRGIFSVAGFHSAPPLEPTAEAEYWVTPIDPEMPEAKAESKLREYNRWVLKWLTIHEALPGHYIQFEHANNVQPVRRRLLRNLFANGPYVEGWAEYIAQVMMDAGFLGNDPRFRLSMGKIRLRVLANTILDVRMHTMEMSDAEAMELMIRRALQTEAEAEGKLRRAKLSSAQLPTYYVGLRDWLALRRHYERRLGQNFNLMAFHNLVLDQGPLPIALLREIVLPRAQAASGQDQNSQKRTW